jgi:hypothetical protein
MTPKATLARYVLTAVLISWIPGLLSSFSAKICRASGCGQERRWLYGGAGLEMTKLQGLFSSCFRRETRFKRALCSNKHCEQRAAMQTALP